MPRLVVGLNELFGQTRIYTVTKSFLDRTVKSSPSEAKKKYALSGEVKEILNQTIGPTSYTRDDLLKVALELRRFKTEGVGVVEASGEAILPEPRGPEAAALWREIREGGLLLVKRLIAENSPPRDLSLLADLAAAVR